MNDLEVLKAMLVRAKIEFKMYDDNKEFDELVPEETNLNIGYSGFVAIFRFDKAGTLIGIGAAE